MKESLSALMYRIIEKMARVGYESMYEERWRDASDIEKDLWLKIASAMYRELKGTLGY